MAAPLRRLGASSPSGAAPAAPRRPSAPAPAMRPRLPAAPRSLLDRGEAVTAADAAELITLPLSYAQVRWRSLPRSDRFPARATQLDR